MMQTKTTVARKMTIPAAKVWDAIARFGRLDAWFPTISTCVVEGSGVGAVRRMDSTRGGKIVDHIVDIQPEKMRLIYERVQSPFAVTSYRGTVEVFESFDGIGVVVWTIDFESTPEEQPRSKRTTRDRDLRRDRGHENRLNYGHVWPLTDIPLAKFECLAIALVQFALMAIG